MAILILMTEQLPIFPLGLVLLPTMEVPLHIFEERYRLMVSECIDHSKPFGIVYYNGSKFRSTGCTATISSVIKEYKDGRRDILVKGNRRFTINSIDSGGDYLLADVKYFSDCETAEKSPDVLQLKDEAINVFVHLAELNNKSLDRKFLTSMGCSEFSFLLASSDLLTTEERQETLESGSAANRIQNIITSAKRAVLRAEAHNKLLDILGENSDIRHIFN